MGYFVMPVRTQDEPEVDDYVIWSTYDSTPVLQGTKDEIRAWYREEFGRSGLRTFDLDDPFERADRLGSSSYVEDGHWDDEDFRAACGDKAGILPRERLREFLVAFWADGVPLREGCIDEAALLLEPFDWEGEEQLTNGAESAGDGS